MALAVVGAVACRRLGPARIALLAGGGLANLLSVVIAAGINTVSGFASVTTQGGYLLLTMIVVAILTAIGVSEVLSVVDGSIRLRRSNPAGTRTRSPIAVATVAVLLAVSVLVPSVLVHRSHADLRAPAYADEYARRVLDALPPRAVLLVGGEEYSMPMIYRQVVDHDRTDVSVASANEVALDWGRELFRRRFGLTDSLVGPTLRDSLRDLVVDLAKTRPVYLDTTAMAYLATVVGYQTEGLVGKVVIGYVNSVRIPNADAVATSLEAADQQDRLTQSHDRAPFENVYFFHSRVHIELAKEYALQKDRSAMLRELRRSIAPFPFEKQPQVALRQLEKNSDPQEALRVLSYL